MGGGLYHQPAGTKRKFKLEPLGAVHLLPRVRPSLCLTVHTCKLTKLSIIKLTVINGCQ